MNCSEKGCSKRKFYDTSVQPVMETDDMEILDLEEEDK